MELVTLEEEFKRNPELRQEDLDYLKEWIRQEKYLPNIPDTQLVTFLQSCYFGIEATKATIKNCYVWRTQQPDYFCNRNPKFDPDLETMTNALAFVILPQSIGKKEIVIFISILNNDATYFYFLETVKLFFMFMDLYLARYGTYESMSIVYDCDPITLPLISKIHIPSLKQLFFYIQEAMPIRLKGLHYINSHSIFDVCFRIFKPFIQQDLMNKIQFHKKGSTSLFSHIDSKIIPIAYGGEAVETIQDLQAESNKMLEDYEPWFKQEEKLRVDLKLCPEANKTNEDNLFGATGSFKKLNID